MLLTSSWWDNIITFKNKRRHVELSSPCSSADKIVSTKDTYVEQHKERKIRLTESSSTLLRARIRKKLNRENTRREFQNQEEHADENSNFVGIIRKQETYSHTSYEKRKIFDKVKNQKKKWVSLREQRNKKSKQILQIKREKYRRRKSETRRKIKQLRVDTGQSKKPKQSKIPDSFESFEKRRKELLRKDPSLKPQKISETEWRRKHRRLMEYGEKYEHSQATSPREFTLQKAKLREQRVKYGKIESWVHPSDRRSYNLHLRDIANLISLDKANSIDNIPIINDHMDPTKPINFGKPPPRKPRQKRYKNNNPENLYLYRAGLL